MKAPFSLSVRLPDGNVYAVCSIMFNKAGDVTRITTFSTTGRAFGPWYSIEDDELEEVDLIVNDRAALVGRK